MPGIEPPRVLVSSQPCRGASHRTSDGFGGICSVRAPLSSAGTHRRGCRHAWLLLPEGEPSLCCRAAACSPLDPGEAGGGRKGLENHFGAGMWWEGQKKAPEHHGSGLLVNAWCHLCCPLQNVVRHRDLLGSQRCGREHFPTGVFPTVHPHPSRVVVLSWECSLGLHLGKPRPRGTRCRRRGDGGSRTETRWQWEGGTHNAGSIRGPGPASSPRAKGSPKLRSPCGSTVLRIFKNRRSG